MLSKYCSVGALVAALLLIVDASALNTANNRVARIQRVRDDGHLEERYIVKMKQSAGKSNVNVLSKANSST
ncbi:hypothetical protein BDF19DRAFT_445404 [Syncephalis fuscata]|nr:hypothetical protein BDF19DRAFT_445404 [Syncephalis fuscata]